MAARVKHCVPTHEVAHLWAHGQDEGWNPQRNFFFHDGVIYSYGHHFPIAKIVTNKRGESAALVTTATRSLTTSGHVSAARGAVSHMTRFNVCNPVGEGKEWARSEMEEYTRRQKFLMESYHSARSRKPDIYRDVADLVNDANAFAAFFGLRSRLKIPADGDAMVEECAAIDKATKAKARQAEKKRAAQIAKLQAEASAKAEEWKNGGNVRLYYYDGPTLLRVVGDELETSHGASVPLSHAIRAFKVLRKLRERAKTYKRNGSTIKIGAYALDEMDDGGTVRAGCHTIEWAEIERVAKLAGVL